MVWFYVEDSLAFNAKAVAAGNAAMGMWVRAGSWSAHELTNGFIPVAIRQQLGSTREANRLQSAGLWVPAEGGFQFHQWHERNRTRDQVEARRKRWRDAKSTKASNAESNGESEDTCAGGSNSNRNHVSNPSGIPLRVNPLTPPTPRQRGARGERESKGDRIRRIGRELAATLPDDEEQA